jgi:hypothetical protein
MRIEGHVIAREVIFDLQSSVRSPAFRPQAFGVMEWICVRRLRPKGGATNRALRFQSFLRMPFHRSQASLRAHLLASFRLAGSSPARINPCPAPS